MSGSHRKGKHGIYSEETLRKMSIGNMGRGKGIPKSEEHKKKISMARRTAIAEGRIVTPKGKNHWSWEGGKYKEKDGYIYVKVENHPNANASGYIFEHRLVMEQYLGRFLTKEEEIHHINGVRDDNRLENLRLYHNHSEHARECHADFIKNYRKRLLDGDR